MPPDLFFTDSPSREKRAVAVCARCPVRDECLDDAVDRDDRHGIRGGMTPAGRKALRRSAA